jgi:hypothetical protein
MTEAEAAAALQRRAKRKRRRGYQRSTRTFPERPLFLEVRAFVNMQNEIHKDEKPG